MKMSWLHSIRLCFVVACVFAMSGVGTVAAQQPGDVWTELGADFTGSSSGNEASTIVGNTFVLPSSGAEVILAEGLVPEESDFEDQLIVNAPEGMGAVAVIMGLASPEAVMDTYASAFSESMDGTTEIDVRIDGQFAAGLYSVDILGVPLFMYITVDATAFPGYMTIQVAIAETDMASIITLLRESVAINGQPMFTDIDEQEIQDMADQYPG